MRKTEITLSKATVMTIHSKQVVREPYRGQWEWVEYTFYNSNDYWLKDTK